MKQLTLVPIGGLANRIYAITSAIAFCKDYDVKLRIIWFKDKGMGADFHSLFDLSSEVDKSKVEIIDAKWYHYIYDRPRKRNLWLPSLWQYLAFRKRIYEKDISSGLPIEKLLNITKSSSSLYMIHFGLFYYKVPFAKELSLVSQIRNKIEDRIRTFSLKDNVIGIHIRRGDHQVSIARSPLSLFIDKINEEIANDPYIRFYVASDSYSVKKKLMKMFGERIITFGGDVKRDNRVSIEDALIELYSLSATKKMYGSQASTFSELAAKLGNIEIEVLSL